MVSQDLARKRRKSIRDQAFPIDGDLAYILCQQFNGYASVTEEIPMIEEEWVLNALREIYDPRDIAILVQDDFGRGIIMGQLAYIRANLEVKLQEEADEYG